MKTPIKIMNLLKITPPFLKISILIPTPKITKINNLLSNSKINPYISDSPI
jgi:hypothetical protein